ncbi:MAG: glyoxylase-like metal-dependent hydrolase (beta-lactamase superfamily II) [Bacteroidia bacterium]|mgnify:FL=1|jgi:glyoxylase-like metal-dependent hydrolase (beta-lactamase superfamily II)|tara:strand:+ start:2851 stop:3486 length:636 start_codon:yes stop_codon:yes gene_type:complete
MTHVHQLTFGPFGENTYLISDEEGNTLVIDPGMYDAQENARMFEYLTAQKLKPIRLILTHAHLDHVFGVNWFNSHYGLTPEVNAKEMVVYDSARVVALQYGLQMDSLVAAEVGLVAETSFRFGEVSFEIRFAPGHSPGSVCFYNEEEKYVISGDVLFQGSVGRTDLPGGDMGTLMGSIRSQLLTMPDEVIVYSGHGPLTTVGQERESNPYL